jgi:hypothetical protein
MEEVPRGTVAEAAEAEVDAMQEERRRSPG